MAIAAIYKGFFFGLFLVGILSQASADEVAEENLAEAKALEEKLVQEQAASAVYDFATSIVDGIMDNVQTRQETRDGLNLTGSYSYSDGFLRRSVTYVADAGGFRIISDVSEPLGDGPHVNPNGQVNVRTSIAGENLEYNITKADIGHFNKPLLDAAEEE